MSECTARYHGTATAYSKHGCRCPQARDARRRYEKLRTAGLLAPAIIPAFAAQRRIRALCRIGWPARTQLLMLGYGPKSMHSQLLNGQQIHRDVHDRVCRLYDRLHMTPGPSTISRARAEKRGWAPPLAWEPGTIDDPTASPCTEPRDKTLIDPVVIDRLVSGYPTKATRAERREATRRMTAAGRSSRQIAAQMGCSVRDVDRLRWEAGITTPASPQPAALEATA